MAQIGIMTPSSRRMCVYVGIYIIHNVYMNWTQFVLLLFIFIYFSYPFIPWPEGDSIYTVHKHEISSRFFGPTAAIPFDRKTVLLYLYYFMCTRTLYTGYNNIIAVEWRRYITACPTPTYYILWCTIYLSLFLNKCHYIRSLFK